ncbi:MAG: ATP-binding protein [Myxococcota bacterium]
MDNLPHTESDEERTVGIRAEDAPGRGTADDESLYRELLGALPVATVVLDRAGLVQDANKAFADLLHLTPDACVGEPFLLWLSRASEREGFGRAFRALAEKDGGGFALDVGLLPRLGPRVDCSVRSSRLGSGRVAVTCHPSSPSRLAPEAELGMAVTRSLDALDQGVMLVDHGGRVVHANPSAASLLGDGVVGRSVLELASRSDVSQLSRALTVARTGSWQGELTLRRRDGEAVPVELSLAAGSGPAVMLVRDLRERRRRAFEERLVAQVDRCLVQADDPRQSVLAACAALGTALGAERVSLLARTGGAWQRWDLIADQPQPIVELADEHAPPQAWAHGRDVVMSTAVDATIRAAFGVAGSLPQSARVALRGPSGVVGHLLLARHDATPWDDRDRVLIGTIAAQIALGLASGLLTLETAELAAYQAMLLNQTTVLLGSVDADGRVVTWNRASEALLGTPASEAEGRIFGVEVGAAQAAEQWTDLWGAVQRDGDVAREITLRHRNGDEIPLHLEGRRLDAADARGGAVFVGLDLRDRRALESQILRSQKLAAVGLLAAGIAHEINNPLSGVVGYSRLLLERDLPAGVREKVEKISQSGDRCRKIVEGVLLFSRQRDGGERSPIDLRALIDRVVGIGEYQWKMHNVRVLRERNDDAVVHADPDQLEQVALNLLSNAVDAMPRGGTMRISLAREGDDVRFTVADEGHGIPDEVLPRIFDPFFSTKEIGKGTGLGLAISYGIVQDHGGDIVVESHAGAGARFTVVLPVRAPDPHPDRNPGSAPGSSTAD